MVWPMIALDRSFKKAFSLVLKVKREWWKTQDAQQPAMTAMTVWTTDTTENLSVCLFFRVSCLCFIIHGNKLSHCMDLFHAKEKRVDKRHWRQWKTNKDLFFADNIPKKVKKVSSSAYSHNFFVAYSEVIGLNLKKSTILWKKKHLLHLILPCVRVGICTHNAFNT